MANNTLQSLTLGAPSSISISANQYPNAHLSVQIASLLRTLTLHDGADGSKCTSLGALPQAAAILRQYIAERDTAPSGNLSIAPLPLDFITNGGTAPLRCLDTEGNEVTRHWTVAEEVDAIGEYSLSPSGVLSVPSGCYAYIKVKAISFADSTDNCVAWLVGGFATKYPSLAPVIAEHPSLAPVIAETPSLAPIITEWPDVVNSLVETGKRNYLQLNGDNWFNTAYVPNAKTDVEVNVSMSNSGEISFFGGRNSPGFLMQQNGGSFRIYTNAWINISGSLLLNTWYKAEMSCSRFAVNGEQKTTYSYTPFGTTPLFIAQASNGNVATRHSKAMEGKFSDVIIKENGVIVHHFAPFVRNGKHGFIDISNVDVFLENLGTGTATFSVEPK